MVALRLMLFSVLMLIATEGLDTDKVLEGFEKTKKFADVIETQGFTDVLKEFTGAIQPWVDTHNIMASFYKIFKPEENDLLQAMNKGFSEVNSRLDDIKRLLEDVILAIDWAIMKFQYSEIEQKILSLSTNLQDAYRAPDPEAGRTKFLLLYHQNYDNSGTLLYNSIVHDDWVFQQNLLKAGMVYTDYTRAAMQDLMRGLISLLMKASAIEIASDKFMGWDTGIEILWAEKLTEVKNAMSRADQHLEGKWEDLMADDMDDLAGANQGVGHSDFVDMAYGFFTEKYYWRYWFVLSYDQLSTYKEHAIMYHEYNTHYRFRWYGRNYVVCSVPKDHEWDNSLAKSWLFDKECIRPREFCYREPAKVMNERLPTAYAQTRSIIKEHSSWAWRAVENRTAHDIIDLWGYGGRWPFFVIYFG